MNFGGRVITLHDELNDFAFDKVFMNAVNVIDDYLRAGDTL